MMLSIQGSDVLNYINAQKENGKETLLFTAEQINKWAATTEETKIRNLGSASFPYADKNLVLLKGKKERMLVDFKKKSVVWKQTHGSVMDEA